MAEEPARAREGIPVLTREERVAAQARVVAAAGGATGRADRRRVERAARIAIRARRRP